MRVSVSLQCERKRGAPDSLHVCPLKSFSTLRHIFISFATRFILKSDFRIPDPTATKPDDWDEDAPPKIPDADAVKPDGWLDDGPEFIPDPEAEQPDDW